MQPRPLPDRLVDTRASRAAFQRAPHLFPYLTMPHTWFITGASRGLGVHIAQAALRAGDRVVATGRSAATVTDSLGPDGDRLLSVALDVTKADQAGTAVAAAVARFGGIDVLVNNAGYGHLGFFEEETL